MDELDELNSKIEDLLGWKFDGKNWRGPGGSVWEEHKNYEWRPMSKSLVYIIRRVLSDGCVRLPLEQNT